MDIGGIALMFITVCMVCSTVLSVINSNASEKMAKNLSRAITDMRKNENEHSHRILTDYTKLISELSILQSKYTHSDKEYDLLNKEILYIREIRDSVLDRAMIAENERYYSTQIPKDSKEI